MSVLLQSSGGRPQSPLKDKSDAIPLEAPSSKLHEPSEEILKDRERPEPLPGANLAKGPGGQLTNERDPESDSGLPDRSSEPNQQPQADTAGGCGALESTAVTVSSSPPPPLLCHRKDSASCSSPRVSRIPVRDAPSPTLDSPGRADPPLAAVTAEQRRCYRWSSPVHDSPTHSPSPSLSCDNLPGALPRDRLPSERGSRCDWQAEEPLSLSSSSGSRSKIPRPVSTSVLPDQLPKGFLPRPPPGKPPARPSVDNRYELNRYGCRFSSSPHPPPSSFHD